MDTSPRDVDIYSGPAWLILQNVKPARKSKYVRAGTVQMVCTCGRKGCPVSFTKSNRDGRRIYATPECEAYAKLMRDRSRPRKKMIIETAKLSGNHYCTKCGTYTDHVNNVCPCGNERSRE